VRPWLRSEKARIALGVLLFLILAKVYLLAGGPSPLALVVWLAWLLFSAVFLRIAALFALDLVQYAREGWNLDDRPPRADMRLGRGRGRRLKPRTILWFGYPAFLLAFGAAALLLGLQVFGLFRIFY
jgi:hypothetical protein